MKKIVYYPVLFIYFIAASCKSSYGSGLIQYNINCTKRSGTLMVSVMTHVKPYSDIIFQTTNNIVNRASYQFEKKLANPPIRIFQEKIFPLDTPMNLLFSNKKGSNIFIEPEDRNRHFFALGLAPYFQKIRVKIWTG